MSDKYSSDNKMRKLFEGFRGFTRNLDERIDAQTGKDIQKVKAIKELLDGEQAQLHFAASNVIAQIKQIIDGEEVQNTSDEVELQIKEEMNFDEDTGMPLSAKGMDMLVKNDRERFRSDVMPIIIKLINKVGEEYGDSLRQIIMSGVNKAGNQSEAFFELLKIAQEKGMVADKQPAEAPAQPDAAAIKANAKDSVNKNLNTAARDAIIKKYDDQIKRAEQRGNTALVDKLRKRKEFIMNA